MENKQHITQLAWGIVKSREKKIKENKGGRGADIMGVVHSEINIWSGTCS